MPKLILLNGPPRSGKDECAKHLYKSSLTPNRPMLFPHWFRLSQPIKDAVAVTWGLTREDVAELERDKDKPQKMFNGLSYRQVQISFSEAWMKQHFGPRIFGELALQRLKRSIAETFVCSDCGFAEEVIPLLELFSKNDILIVKLYRTGYTFEGDSRGYIRIEGVREVYVHNNSTLDHLTMQVETLVRAWINGETE